MAEKINLYILTGFLGAGKTTVLMRILEQLKDDHVGVIQSEFNQQGMDGAALEIAKIPDDDGTGILEMVEVSKGSIFCSCHQESLVQALTRMSGHDLKNLFLESYGLTDPANIQEVLEEVHHKTGDIYELKGVICLIDAKNFIEQSKNVETVHRQLQHCHLAVINKADLVSPELLIALTAQVRRINPHCEIQTCSFGQFNLDFMCKNLLEHQWEEKESKTEMVDEPQPLFLRCDQPVKKEDLLQFLNLIKENTYRIKGFMELTTGWHQIDTVGTKVECRPCKEHLESKLVFISKIGSAIVMPLSDAWEHTVNAKMELLD